ncbi:hypothetical protein FNO01nite_13960 [Flavobacterium noncentrifugens]|uniref:Major paralogous domain-containing protein n=1 Tax=Flavobacterium noncentrifugens TaxID=1128970 RepID=A0A1G8W1C3_9FLAO|nr:fibrobacter succinogenes major paralogous domain-containing protein [Flavobacterium noncentrifugens]GEP50724.1 hypothetical protein FNO01nite_13960 [Flavobacterium noncentrifugens]SDJ71853.1 major paralogous domain-containing protein [Flavobacterium noncentrifugens]
MNPSFFHTIFFTSFFIILFGCSKSQEPTTIKIGNQEWTTKNLDVVTFRNGDTIPESKSDSDWKNSWEESKPAWCYYDNDPKNGQKYGKLYNWYALNDPRGIAPKGYHLPSKAEWDSLISYLGGDKIAGKKIKITVDGNGTNESGFLGLLGGLRYANSGFTNVGKGGGWWRHTEGDTYNAWFYYISYSSDYLLSHNFDKGMGISIRCLRD